MFNRKAIEVATNLAMLTQFLKDAETYPNQLEGSLAEYYRIMRPLRVAVMDSQHAIAVEFLQLIDKAFIDNIEALHIFSFPDEGPKSKSPII